MEQHILEISSNEKVLYFIEYNVRTSIVRTWISQWFLAEKSKFYFSKIISQVLIIASLFIIEVIITLSQLPAMYSAQGIFQHHFPCKKVHTILDKIRYTNFIHQFHNINQGILKGEVSLYCWPPVWLVWNQLYDSTVILPHLVFSALTEANSYNLVFLE